MLRNSEPMIFKYFVGKRWNEIESGNRMYNRTVCKLLW